MIQNQAARAARNPARKENNGSLGFQLSINGVAVWPVVFSTDMATLDNLFFLFNVFCDPRDGQ
jgi:hypothetical protein